MRHLGLSDNDDQSRLQAEGARDYIEFHFAWTSKIGTGNLTGGSSSARLARRRFSRFVERWMACTPSRSVAIESQMHLIVSVTTRFTM